MADFEIYETNVTIAYTYNVSINLHDGTYYARQVTDGQILVSRIEMTAKSKFTFPGTDTGEGLIQLWLIILQNGRSFLYAIGTLGGTPIKVGGNFGDYHNSNEVRTATGDYVRVKIKEWANIYSRKDTVGLINEMNNLINNLHEHISKG